MIIFIQSPSSGSVETLLNMIFLTLFLIIFSFPLPMPYAPVTPEIIVLCIYTEMFYLGALIFFFSLSGISSPSASYCNIQIQTVPQMSLPAWSLSHATSDPPPAERNSCCPQNSLEWLNPTSSMALTSFIRVLNSLLCLLSFTTLLSNLRLKFMLYLTIFHEWINIHLSST